MGNSQEVRQNLRLELRVRNNVLWHAIFDRYKNVNQFCLQESRPGYRFNAVEVGKLLNFKALPFVNGNPDKLRLISLRLAMVLGIPAEELFPLHLYQERLGGIRVAEVDSFSALPGAVASQIQSLPAPAGVSQLQTAEQQELHERIERVLQTLPFRHREMIRLRFGLEDGYEYSYEEIARIFNVSRSSAQQYVSRGIEKLQHPVRTEKLKEFTEE